MKADRHYWRTADGRYVETGHLDAEVLAFPAGSDLPDELARELGLFGDEPKKAKQAAAEEKQAPAPATKQRSRSADK